LREHLPALTWNPPEASFLAWPDCTALATSEEILRTAFQRMGAVSSAG
jgi:bifunctional pyridoxal-dependent enzyme with beta-cystathionase and maltose regulon repressor activities